MPGNNALPSYLGNVVAARQKLSAVRQRLSLEPSMQAGHLQAIAPSPPEGADMDKKGAAISAVSAPQEIDPTMFDPTANPITKNPKYEQMASAVQTFLDENNNGIDDRAEPLAAAPQPPNDPAGAGAATGSLVNDPRMISALQPMTNFFKQNGRLPSIDELREMADIRRDLKENGQF